MSDSSKDNYYYKLTRDERKARALEMVKEQQDDHDRLHALVSTLLAHMEPNTGEDHVDHIAFRLTEILDNQLQDISQLNRLEECIMAM